MFPLLFWGLHSLLPSNNNLALRFKTQKKVFGGQHDIYILTPPKTSTPKCFLLDIKKEGNEENNYNRPSGVLVFPRVSVYCLNNKPNSPGREGISYKFILDFFKRLVRWTYLSQQRWNQMRPIWFKPKFAFIVTYSEILLRRVFVHLFILFSCIHSTNRHLSSINRVQSTGKRDEQVSAPNNIISGKSQVNKWSITTHQKVLR